MEKYDLIVIGGGPGGYGCALRAAELGLKTIIFERERIGGTCLNRGCIPTKALLHSARLYSQIRNSAMFGIKAGEPEPDEAAIDERKNQVVDRLVKGLRGVLKGGKVRLIEEKAVVCGPNTVRSASGVYSAASIVIASGTLPSVPPIRGMELEGVEVSDGILERFSLTDSLVIIGGGVIGVELAALYSDFGCKVTIVEALDRILYSFDRELSQSVAAGLKKSGAEIFTGASVERISREGDSLAVAFRHRGGECLASGKRVLAATGRKPNTEGLFEGISPEMDRGFIKTDSRGRSSVPTIYAAGDVAGGVQLAHKAEAEGIAIAEHICGLEPSIRLDTIPSCVYLSPELASAGLSLEQAQELGIKAKASKAVMGSNGRTVIEEGSRGFVKLVFNRDSQAIIGAHLLCERATDLISELVTAINLGLSARELAAAVRPHPSFSEAVTAAARAAIE